VLGQQLPLLTLAAEARAPVVWVHGARKPARSPITAPAVAVLVQPVLRAVLVQPVLRAVLVQPVQRVLYELPVVCAAPIRDSYARRDPVHSRTR
jgi:hypothetical protein